MDKNLKESKFESQKEQGSAKIEGRIARAKAKIKGERRERWAWIVLMSMIFISIILHFKNILTLPAWLLVILGVLFFIFFMLFIISDSSEAKGELATNEAIKKNMSKSSDSTNLTTQYFDSLVNINKSLKILIIYLLEQGY